MLFFFSFPDNDNNIKIYSWKINVHYTFTFIPFHSSFMYIGLICDHLISLLISLYIINILGIMRDVISKDIQGNRCAMKGDRNIPGMVITQLHSRSYHICKARPLPFILLFQIENPFPLLSRLWGNWASYKLGSPCRTACPHRLKTTDCKSDAMRLSSQVIAGCNLNTLRSTTKSPLFPAWRTGYDLYSTLPSLMQTQRQYWSALSLWAIILPQ